MNLGEIVRRSAIMHPERQAIVDIFGSSTYEQLDSMADRFAATFARRGLAKGDRVGIWAPKGRAVVAAMQGALRLGVIYVPIDPGSPVGRVRKITDDCDVSLLLIGVEQRLCLGADEIGGCPVLILTEALADITTAYDVPSLVETDLAYILYTSGSTGVPKGVCITHRAAVAFIQWAVEDAGIESSDRLSNHAPFNFDLSVFDLYAAFSVGATCVIVPESIAYNAARLLEFIGENRITVWYSVPSALILMIDHARLLERRDLELRTVIFAGEPFPIQQLRRLRDGFPRCTLLNYYGPTETNVCTSYRVESIEPGRVLPVPIGSAACSNIVYAATIDGEHVSIGEQGELCVEGPTVMAGYWGGIPHCGPYKTGDLVRRIDASTFEFVGRIDDMLKVRGYRVEPGEIEAVLAMHPMVSEAVVVYHAERRSLVAAIVHKGEQPTLLSLKKHCAAELPTYMIISDVVFVPHVLRTANGKVDRRAMLSLVLNSGPECL